MPFEETELFLLWLTSRREYQAAEKAVNVNLSFATGSQLASCAEFLVEGGF